MELQILDSRSKKVVATLDSVLPTSTIADVKAAVGKRKNLGVDRMEIRQEPKSKGLPDGKTLESVGVTTSGSLYLKDLGPQVGYKTVFIAEYLGPLLVYLVFYFRPALVYDSKSNAQHPLGYTAK
jgi:very-long-chain enoyl-CoA reductase